MRVGRIIAGCCVASCVALASAQSFAQSNEGMMAAQPLVSTPAAVPPVQLVHERRWGLGTTLGGGVAVSSAFAAGMSSTSGPVFALLFPTFDARIFLSGGYSVDLSVPVLNLAVVMASLKLFAWQTDGYFNFNFGRSSVRFLLGPGLGFTTLIGSLMGTSVAGFSLRIPAVIGMEVLSAQRGFGFQLAARPWVEFAIAGAAVGSSSAVGGGVGGGALLTIGFFGYSTQAVPRTGDNG